MKPNRQFLRPRRRAFTLVELLVVMAVIAALAAILFPVFGNIKKGGALKRTRAQLAKVVMAIEAYKAQHGHYPPDNPDNPAVNPLFYELAGTTNLSASVYLTDGGQGITNPPTFFGSKVSGLVNVSRGSGDEAQRSKSYLIGIKPDQYLEVTNLTGVGTVLGLPDKGPLMWYEPYEPPTRGDRSINPFRYVSTGPTNNPNHFDLWVDIVVAGKTNRISNWREKEQIVP
jgi:prepilin-type N-terminal cleavage/methylation domain-containing protein